MLKDNCENYDGPMSDLCGLKKEDQKQSKANANQKTKGGKRRDQNFVVRDLITCLALCHNVTPVYPDELDKTIKEFQASSPDEVALVKFADTMGMQLIDRDQGRIVIKTITGGEEEYEVLANFPFSSESKRMGIVLRHSTT